VIAVGVKLAEAPDARSRGEVHIRILSGQCSSWLGRVAPGDLHPLRYPHSPNAPGSGPGRIARAVIGRMRANTGMADSMTTGLADQGGSESGNDATAGGKPRLGESASGKDPL
jgi:hypothetical protein